MVAITLPDGSIREFESAISGAEIAAAIGPGLMPHSRSGTMVVLRILFFISPLLKLVPSVTRFTDISEEPAVLTRIHRPMAGPV